MSGDAPNVPLTTDRATLRSTVMGVLWNASNFPEKVQARLLGQDMGPLADRVTDAVCAHLSVRDSTPTGDAAALIADLRDEAGNWDPEGEVGPRFTAAADALEASEAEIGRAHV